MRDPWMVRAINLAKKGEYTVRSNPLVGCVLVKNDEVVGEGLHWQLGGPHAEIVALCQAGERAKEATCYVTLEPCVHEGRTGPCVEALIAAGMKEVIVATQDPDPRVNGKGIAALRSAGITVKEGVLAEEARAINKGFFSRMERGRPYVRGKIAMSVDGRIAMKNGESQWITGAAAREDVHRWRARSGAILTTGKTVQADDCRLTVRGVEIERPEGVAFHPPLRVIMDHQRRVSVAAKIFQEPGEILHITEKEKGLKEIFYELGERAINDVWVEAGPTLLGALLQAGWIDEWIIYIAPKWLGHEALPMAYLPGLENLKDHIMGQFSEMELLGEDLRLTAILKPHEY